MRNCIYRGSVAIVEIGPGNKEFSHLIRSRGTIVVLARGSSVLAECRHLSYALSVMYVSTWRGVMSSFALTIITYDSHFLTTDTESSPWMRCWTWKLFGWLDPYLVLLIYSLKIQVCYSATVSNPSSYC